MMTSALPLQRSPTYTPGHPAAAVDSPAPSRSKIKKPLSPSTPPTVHSFPRIIGTAGVAGLRTRSPDLPLMSISQTHGMKPEVLIFDGPGICPVSRDNLVNSLNAALAFNYWVGTIDHQGLRTEPWAIQCALLVFPHCTHTQPYDELNDDRPTISRIRQFVEDGGSFLGICGGAYFASKSAEWDRHQWGSPDLAFWPWLSRGPYLHEGVQTHEFTLPAMIDRNQVGGANNRAPYCDLHWDSGGEFICERGGGNIPFAILGCYSSNRYAGVRCTVGTGTAVLWHARLECSFQNREVEDGFKLTYANRVYDIEVCFEECLGLGGGAHENAAET